MGWGGQEIRTLTEAAGFVGRGHRVVVYAPPGSRIAEEAPRFGVTLETLPIGRTRVVGGTSLARALTMRTAPPTRGSRRSRARGSAAGGVRRRCSFARATCRSPCRAIRPRGGSTAARRRAS